MEKINECTCVAIFNQLKGWKLTMKGMKSVAIKWFIPHSRNKWECRRCGKEHVKNW